MEPTDSELAQRARDGDRSALDALVDRHAEGLYRLAVLMAGNDADAQDLVQETFLAAWEGLARFEGRSAVRTWLVGILVRQAAMQRRGGARHRVPSLEAAPEPQADRRRLRSGWVERADARMDLMGLLAGLSPEHRQVVVLRELEGLSYEEMARMLQVPRGTVESRLFRAREALRELAGEE